MGAALIPILIIVVVLVVGVLMVRQVARREMAVEEHAAEPDTDTLRYRVPEGEDPVAVVAALQAQGYEAVTDHRHGRQDVLVVCPVSARQDREPVRAVIARAEANLEGDPSQHPVRFIDE